jgi:hypothetical protein
MAEKYLITRAEIVLESGITVTADLSSIDAIRQLVADLTTAGFGTPTRTKSENKSNATSKKEEESVGVDDPASRIETEAGLDSGRLLRAKILAIKDGVPQILRTTVFGNVTESVLVLMFALEQGLRQNPVNYEDFSNLFEAQNLKTGSPLSMIITNTRNAGYLDNRAYGDGRRLRLTAKGHTKAIEILKRVAASG